MEDGSPEDGRGTDLERGVHLGGPLFLPKSEIDVVAPRPSCCLGAMDGWLVVLKYTPTVEAQKGARGAEIQALVVLKNAQELGRDSAGCAYVKLWCCLIPIRRVMLHSENR